MKYFKMVSGKGRVELSEKELEEMRNACVEDLKEEPSKLEILEQKVEKISKMFDSLQNSEFFKGLLSSSGRRVDENGDS